MRTSRTIHSTPSNKRRRRMRRERGRDAGFTLIELTVVVFLMALVASVVYARLGAVLPRQALLAAARRLGSAVALARSQAILESRPMALRYSDAPPGLEVLRMPTEDRRQDGDEPPLWRVRLGRDISLKVRFAAGHVAPLSADRNIACSAAGVITPHDVHLRSRQGHNLLLRVHPLTGRVQIREIHE